MKAAFLSAVMLVAASLSAIVGSEPQPTAPPSVLLNPEQFDAATLRVIGSVCEVTVGSGAVMSRGSGTLVAVSEDKALVLSCRHVCEKVGNHVSLAWPQYGEEAFGTVVHVEQGTLDDWHSDLALIVCDRPKGIAPVQTSGFCNQCGPFVAIGWRQGQIRVAFAERAALVDGCIKTNAPFVGGQSGGALFDRFGKLVGVTVASSTDFGLSSMPQELLGKFGLQLLNK